MVIREVIRTHKFKASFTKLKDRKTKDRVIKQIEKIIENPDVGKPLRYGLKGERSVRVSPYRLVYSIEGETLYLLRFFHRGEGY